MTENFWNIPEVKIRTPLAILREQATALSNATHGLLQGDVFSRQIAGSQSLYHILRINVPGLNDYKFDVLRYSHPITLYPGMLTNLMSDAELSIDSEEKFVEKIKMILSGDAMGKAIAALLAQVTLEAAQ